MKKRRHYSVTGLNLLMAHENMNVSTLAALSNISRSTISNYKGYQRPLTDRAATRLCNAMGYYPEVLDVLERSVTRIAENFRRPS